MSAKAEHWHADSAVAISNGIGKCYMVPAKVKQAARRLLGEQYGGKSVTYRVFALLIYVALRENLRGVRQIIIDQDYTGEAVEVTVRNLLLNLLRHERPEISAGFIVFTTVKNSRTDILAREVFQRKLLPDAVVTWPTVEAILYRNKK